ncbi:MAG: twin-arginine translocation pathway signal [Synechococcaceae cyanobacterium]|nr:twin-arginine translocation pathway signal [Synechococcaceae cyanobacterium]
MADPLLPRRGLLRLGALSGLLLVAGCRRQRPLLLATRGDLPALWTRGLPRDWQVRLLEDPAAVAGAAAGDPPPALLQLGDGWAAELPVGRLQPIGTPELIGRLDASAAPVSRLFGPPGRPGLAFPWSVSPWVLALRNRSDLLPRAAGGWDVLLDPSLRGRVVLPSSPRVSIALMGADGQRLARLRRQALAHDDRDALNLLLSGEAEAAVVPRHRLVPLLRRDPRLQGVLPASGSPLAWNLLLRPAGALPEPPLDWLGEILEAPLLARLLAAGWVPPLPREPLQRALAGFPEALARLLLPPQAVLARCRSLPPLAPTERERLQALWDGAAPGRPGTKAKEP